MASGRKPKGKHPDKKLTPAFVRKTTKPGRHCDGNGLYLKIDPSGARRWEQRLVIKDGIVRLTGPEQKKP